MGSRGLAVLPEVRRSLKKHGIGVVDVDQIVLADGGEPIEYGKPPARILADPMSGGLDYLRLTQPNIALLLTPHRNGQDFIRLANRAGHLLTVPVVGVEAAPRYRITPTRISPPKLSVYPMLRKFHKREFAWLKERGILALPFDPQPEPPLAEYLKSLDTMLQECCTGTSGLSLEANAQLARILGSLLGIYDAWGGIARFGELQQHEQVAGLWHGNNDPRSIVMGAAHTYELDIMQVYCGLADAFALDLGRQTGIAAEDLWFRYWQREVASAA